MKYTSSCCEWWCACVRMLGMLGMLIGLLGVVIGGGDGRGGGFDIIVANTTVAIALIVG